MLKIKTNSRIFSIVFILAFFVSAFCIAAKAETISSETYESTITVNIKTDDNPLENVKLKLYKIAGGKDSGSYTVSEKLKAYSLEYNFLDNTTFDSLITTLEGYIAADNIQPDYEGSTDIGGKALFENLPYGAYLLTGDTYNDDAVTVTPVSTLVFLPYRDDKGEVNCNAVIELKCSIKKAPASPEKITVYKVWKDNNDSVRPSEVKISLYQDDKLYETVNLNKSNNWRYQWANLPADKKWSVAEINVPDGYTAAVNRTDNEFYVTNTKVTKTSTTVSDKTLPQTGLLWWPVPLLSAVGIAFVVMGVIVYKKHDK